jgi:hypothetical protein
MSIADGDPVRAEDIPGAVTARPLVYDDGTNQSFEPDGRTVYVDGGRPTEGEWYVDENGHFCSFWPPSYRACYDLAWIVADGAVVGLRFTERDRGSRFTGRFR